MTGWQVIRLVAGREISERVRGRTMRWMTVATALLVVAGIIIPGLIKGSSKPTRIGLVGPAAQALAPTLKRSATAQKVRVTVSQVADGPAARAEVKRGSLDAALSVQGQTARVQVKQSLSPSARAVIQTALDVAHLRDVLARAGVPPARILQALAPVPMSTTALSPSPPDRAARNVAAIAAALLMYIALAMYGSAVATGVAQEKTSRTAEVLLSAVRPRHLLTGKVIGIGATGLGQLAIAAAAGLIANALVHSTKIPSSIWGLLPGLLLCFLAGFLLYAFVFAATGALVARQEELQAVSVPIGMPLLIGYLLVYAEISSPDATWLKVVSFLPPLTATVMPARIALGHVAWWEFLLAALIMAASIYGLARFAARIYANALIHSGPRVGWGAALRLGRGQPAAGAVSEPESDSAPASGASVG